MNNNPEIYNSPIIHELLDAISPSEGEKIKKKMLIAAKIQTAMKARNWKGKDLLEALGKKNPSVVTKWLSGLHNFTIETLIDIERVLEINILDLTMPIQKTNKKHSYRSKKSNTISATHLH